MKTFMISLLILFVSIGSTPKTKMENIAIDSKGRVDVAIDKQDNVTYLIFDFVRVHPSGCFASGNTIEFELESGNPVFLNVPKHNCGDLHQFGYVYQHFLPLDDNVVTQLKEHPLKRLKISNSKTTFIYDVRKKKREWFVEHL